MKRKMDINQRKWHKKVRNALWNNWIRMKKAIGTSLYKPIYCKEARIPLSLEFPSLELAKQLEFEDADQRQFKMEELVELEEL
ncbi:hypothetical protein KI387_034991, partial [Taxus chinensis]